MSVELQDRGERQGGAPPPPRVLGPVPASAGTDVGNGFGAIGFVPAAQFVQVNVSNYGDPEDRPAPCHPRAAFIDTEGACSRAAP